MRSRHFVRIFCPPRSAPSPGVEYAVGGPTAQSHDFNAMMKSSAPLVFGFVLLFAFLLLLVAFRSIVIALKAIVLNLLSVGAAYGMLVAIFQWGWGENLLDFNSTGGIASWLPMFLFVILFGLSMDYHVFILSRIREAFDRGLSTEDAVEHGIRTTAGVVTGASIVMVAVFSVFAILPVLDLKEMGIGLAAAILIDATIVRAVLLPAIDDAARGQELVPPQVARVAAESRARALGRAGPPGRRQARVRARRVTPPPAAPLPTGGGAAGDSTTERNLMLFPQPSSSRLRPNRDHSMLVTVSSPSPAWRSSGSTSPTTHSSTPSRAPRPSTTSRVGSCHWRLLGSRPSRIGAVVQVSARRSRSSSARWRS